MRHPARALVALALSLALPACRTEAPRGQQHRLSGQVLAVRPDAREILIEHRDIPGFMPGMRMPFKVRDERLLSGRRPGDLVTATLNVEDSDAWLSAIEPTGRAPLPDSGGAPLVSAATMLEVGDLAPETSLTDQGGRPFTLRDWRGNAVAMTFIYTRCPLPQFCPLMDRRFAEVQRFAEADAALAGRVRLLSVSFDPEHDSQRVLAGHAAKVGAQTPTWTFATGMVADVDALAARFGVSVVRERDRTITHNLRTVVINPAGRVTALYSGNDWTAETLTADLRRAVVGDTTPR